MVFLSQIPLLSSTLNFVRIWALQAPQNAPKITPPVHPNLPGGGHFNLYSIEDIYILYINRLVQYFRSDRYILDRNQIFF